MGNELSDEFVKLMDAIKNAEMSMDDRLAIMTALAIYIGSK